MRRVIVAGFEPNDDGLNASQVVIQSLECDPPDELVQGDAEFVWIVLPGNTNALKETLDSRLRALDPQACLLVGQAPGRSKVTLERIATNIRDFMRPDRAGNVEVGSTVIENGPPAYLTNIDIIPILEELWRRNIPAAPSNYAGNHLCNQALYLTLHYAHVHTENRMAGVFMHLPLLPEQVHKRWANEPTMPLSQLRDAVTAAALVLAKAI